MEKIAISLTKWIGSTSSLIVHTIIFAGAFVAYFFGITLDEILLVLTTVVSLEAIYLAIFIQMTVNRNAESLQEVETDIDEIQKDVDEIQKDVDEIQEDVDEIQEDEKQDDVREEQDRQTIEAIKVHMQKIIEDIEKIKNRK